MKRPLIFICIIIILIKVLSECGDGDGIDKTSDVKQLTNVEQKTADSIEVEESVRRIIAENEQKRQEEIDSYQFNKTKAGRIYKKHPEWSKDDCRKLANNQIWIGMTFEMLKYKRGLPNHASPSNYGKGDQWQWCWDDFTPSCFYDKNDDGIIDSYN